jgi:hypothetical protein
MHFPRFFGNLCQNLEIVVYLTSSCVIWAFFGMSGPRVPKKAQITQERVEYNVFFVRRAPQRLQIAENL